MDISEMKPLSTYEKCQTCKYEKLKLVLDNFATQVASQLLLYNCVTDRHRQLVWESRAIRCAIRCFCEALFDALDGEGTLLMRASWMRKQKGRRLPKRGGPLPPEATNTVAELREIHSRSGAKHALPVITISHFWRTKEHPDPDGETLGLIADALDSYWGKFRSKGVTDLAVLIDWCALFQAPRTEEQQRLFDIGLKAINQVSSHCYVAV
eukprot:2831078-Prymnesium_polylepis.2